MQSNHLTNIGKSMHQGTFALLCVFDAPTT